MPVPPMRSRSRSAPRRRCSSRTVSSRRPTRGARAAGRPSSAMADREKSNDQEWALQRRLEDVFAKLGEKFGDLTGRVETKIRPEVTFDDVGGVRQAKAELRGFAVALTNPDLYAQWGITPPKGLLLYGPPGTGKTKLTQALATASGAIFYHLKLTNLTSKFGANTGELLQEILRIATGEGTAVLFLDEAQALSLEHLLPPPPARAADARGEGARGRGGRPPGARDHRERARRDRRLQERARRGREDPLRSVSVDGAPPRDHQGPGPLQGHGLHADRLLRQLPHLLRGGPRRVPSRAGVSDVGRGPEGPPPRGRGGRALRRSEEPTAEIQSQSNIGCRLSLV